MLKSVKNPAGSIFLKRFTIALPDTCRYWGIYFSSSGENPSCAKCGYAESSISSL
jgi:hypothetical protein